MTILPVRNIDAVARIGLLPEASNFWEFSNEVPCVVLKRTAVCIVVYLMGNMNAEQWAENLGHWP